MPRRAPAPCLAGLAALALLAGPAPASALFHIAVISEILTSYGGDAAVQAVEIEMRFPGQTHCDVLDGDALYGACVQ